MAYITLVLPEKNETEGLTLLIIIWEEMPACFNGKCQEVT